jgi:HlyD family secretion protein
VSDGAVNKPVRIRTGVSDGSFTEVVEGDLQAGDLIITDAGSASDAAAARPGGMRRGPF